MPISPINGCITIFHKAGFNFTTLQRQFLIGGSQGESWSNFCRCHAAFGKNIVNKQECIPVGCVPAER